MFIVNLYIDDEESIMLGIFNHKSIAHEHVIKLLEECAEIYQYELIDDCYCNIGHCTKDGKYCYFKIHITEYVADEITIPDFMKK